MVNGEWYKAYAESKEAFDAGYWTIDPPGYMAKQLQEPSADYIKGLIDLYYADTCAAGAPKTYVDWCFKGMTRVVKRVMAAAMSIHGDDGKDDPLGTVPPSQEELKKLNEGIAKSLGENKIVKGAEVMRKAGKKKAAGGRFRF